MQQFVSGLPADLPASVFIVLHTAPASPSILPHILTRAGKLKAEHATEGTRFENGHIYIAPPDRHMILRDGTVHLVRGPTENRHRPAIDPLFRSAAREHGPRVIGVLLSGMLDDGTSGMDAIKARGGLAIVQDPDTATFPDMPRNAMDYVDVDEVVPIEEMGAVIAQRVREPVPQRANVGSQQLGKEIRFAEFDMAEIENENRIGEPSAFVCPDCSGTLWEVDEGGMLRFRCRVGHAYSAESLLSAKADSTEAALWAAVRALEEDAALARRLAQRSRQREHPSTALRYDRQAESSSAHAAALRDLLLQTQRSDRGTASAPAPTSIAPRTGSTG